MPPHAGSVELGCSSPPPYWTVLLRGQIHRVLAGWDCAFERFHRQVPGSVLGRRLQENACDSVAVQNTNFVASHWGEE